MKAKMIFASLMAFAVSAVAAPSLDRVTLDQQIQRAQTEHKTIVLEVGAAWCGPCNNFAFDLHKGDNLKDFANRGYIFMKVESEKVMQGSPLNLVDYLPSLVHFFPTFYVYDVNSGWKFLGSFNTYQDLVAGLQEVRARNHVMTIDEMKAYFAEVAARPNGTIDEGPGSASFSASIMDLAANYSYADAKTILATLREQDKAYPSLALGDVADELQSLFFGDYVAYGKIDFATFKKDFPVAASRLSDLSNSDFSGRLFGMYLAGQVKSSGLASTVAGCSATWASTRALFVQGSLSDADFKTKLAGLDLGAAVLCADIEIHLTGATDAVKQRVDQLDIDHITDWYVLGAVGKTDAAIKIYHQMYIPYEGGYEGQLKTLNKRLEKAIQDGDQKKIDELKAKIEIVQFQADHHAEVDRDVEAALKSGTEIQAITVFN